MSSRRKLAHKIEIMKGGAKKTAGRITGNRRLQAEGRRDQVKGKAKQAGVKLMDAFRR